MTETSKPWYRYTIPWLIIAVLTLTLLSGISMIIISSGGKDSVVDDNYYKHGLTINTNISQQKMAHALKIRLQSAIVDKRQGLEITGNFKRPDNTLVMQLKHPTLKKQDIQISFTRSNSSYRAAIPSGVQGRYYFTVQATGGQWGLKGEIVFATGKRSEIKVY